MQVPAETESLYAGDLFSVSGKVIVVTGGGTGLGRMMAEGYVANGAKVYIVGRREGVLQATAKEINAEFAQGSSSCVPLRGDVSSKSGAQALRDALRAAGEERVDLLVNNAGVQKAWRNPITTLEGHNDRTSLLLNAEKLIWDVEEWAPDWADTMQGNVAGPYFATAALVPLLRKSELPSVIIIASIAAFANQRAVSTLTYGASKAAVVHMAALLAGRLAPMKIRVNTIVPGAFPSEITTTTNEAGEKVFKPPAFKAGLRCPVGRAGQRHEIVGPALLLASKAGGYMDNAVINVCGGRLLDAGIWDGIPRPSEMFAE